MNKTTGTSLTLVLGGARSGKTAFAEAEALSRPRSHPRSHQAADKPLYLATGEAFDDEMHRRIERHRQQREGRFETLEEPRNIAALIRGMEAGRVMVVDSIGTWLTNLMLADADGADSHIGAEIAATLQALGGHQGHIVLVSDEAGLGIVPENAMARRFRDDLGDFNQQVASIADRVVLIVAGQKLIIKDDGQNNR